MTQKGAEMNEWQRIGEIPLDSGRLVLLDPQNVDDVVNHEDQEMDEQTDWSTNYELVSNDFNIAVALILSTGLGDGVYPVEARFEEAEGAIRVAEIRIRFLPHPQVGYELPR
jgi:hypothetical protein